MRRTAAWLTTAALSLAVLLTAAASSPAVAHDLPPTGFAQIDQQGRQVHYDLSLRFDQVATALDLDPSAVASGSDAERAAALRGRHSDLEALLSEGIAMSYDGAACDGALSRIDAGTFEGVSYALPTVTFTCPGEGAGPYEVHHDLFFDGGAGAEQGVLVDFSLGGSSGRLLFHSDERELVIGEDPALSSIGRSVRLGVGHILEGLDHVLFVVALVIGARSLRDVAKVATAFTGAHSITLALAGVGWVEMPPIVVEPLIALSIAVVAFQNLMRRELGHRWLVVFAFGLLHGLGFAGTVRFPDEAGWSLVSGLLAFNTGIELGQLLLISVAFPVVVVARRVSWSGAVQAGLTGAIGAVGLFWFAERLIAA